MITLNAVTPPAIPAERDLASLLQLVGLLSDPQATKDRIEAFATAAADARQALADAQSAQAELVTARAAHDKSVADECIQHHSALERDREAFDVECNHRRQVIVTRETEIEQLRASAQADADAAAKLKADLTIRLERVRSAAA